MLKHIHTYICRQLIPFNNFCIYLTNLNAPQIDVYFRQLLTSSLLLKFNSLIKK